ncbi:MAG: extracellular solute-binding protein [Clostridia bacterium]|nr:extracellular solute-binding protein [Clostridia bacterium]
MRKNLRITLALFVMLTITSLMFAAGQPEKTTAGSSVTTLEVWSRGEELKQFVPGFESEHPTIKVNVTVIPDADMTPKLITVIASGKGVPDLFMQEASYITYLVEADLYTDLRQAPFNVEAYSNQIWPATLSVGTDSTGAVRALTWQSCPGSIIYRRDIAQKYFGTDEPARITDQLSTDAKFLTVAERMKQDGVRIVSSFKDLFDMKVAARTKPWVVEGKLVIDSALLAYMDMAKNIIGKGYDLGVDQWTPEWIAAVEADDMFSYVLPSWGYQYVVKPGANTTSGKWAIAAPPVPYISGGSYMGIYKGTQKKEAAWEFLKYVTLNEESQYAYAKASGDYVSLKAVNERLAKEKGEAVLGGQNPYEIYNVEMAGSFNKLNTIYDSQLNNAFISAVKAYAEGKSKEQALNQFKADVLNAFPEIIVE